MAIRDMTLTGLFTGLLAIGSQIYISVGVMPITLQVLFVLLSGVILGSRLGVISVVVWAILGSFGLPVFPEGASGIAVFIGPTSGFIFGFMACVYIVGYVAENYELSYKSVFGAMVIGLLVMYILGFGGFIFVFKYVLHKAITMKEAFTLAVLPFLPVDLIKAVAATYIGIRIRRSLLKVGLLKVKQSVSLSK
jgi:biotin transport system substrate-specific component